MEPLIKFEDDEDEGEGEGEGARHDNYVFSANYKYDDCLPPRYPPSSSSSSYYYYNTDSNNDESTIPATSPPHPPPATTTGCATAGGVVGPSMSTSSSSSSSEDEEERCNNHFSMMEATSKRLDYMLQFLDRKLESYSSPPPLPPSLPDPQAPLRHPYHNHDHNNHNHRAVAAEGGGLPEFVAPVGWAIFAPPLRAPLHPGRPPPLEVRPHPLRESQLGRSLTALSATPSHLCAAREDGPLLLWDYSLLCAPPAADGDNSDSDSAPHVVCQPGGLPSPVTCLVVAGESHTVWSGHKDGRIRCWKLPQPNNESLSWVAHPMKPLLSMTFSSYGDLWSSSEGGSLRIWPREAILRSLSSTADESHVAALLVERSYVDRATCSVLNSDIRYLVSDHSRAKVWSAGYLSFALWDARSRELLKVFNLDGQVERMDPLAGQDFALEDDIKLKILAGSKKERVQNSLGFFQRSRNAIIGAADVVRRVAVKGGFGDDNRRNECLIATPDGLIWTGCTNGLLVQWDGNGNRLQDFHYHSSAVQCLSSFGLRLWVGYASGVILVLDLEGNLLGGWVAHSSPVIKMAVGAGYVFTLASHGGIRGWNVASPGPLDSILCSELAGKEFLYTRTENVRVLAGTWNVAQGRASPASLISWLGSAAGDASIVVVGLQEVEMGAGVLAMSAAKETVGLEGSSVGQWWLDMIGKTLDEGSTFVRIGSRQLAGLLIALWIRNDLRAHVGDVDAAAVPCGFGRAIGNKGAVGLRIRIYDRTMCFVNCHFAAHLEAVNRRNADFDHVYRTMTFGRPSNLFNAAAAGAASAVQMLRIPNVMGATSVEAMPELSQADMVIFLGDFNYRLDGISYDEARDFISQRCFDWLKERDQLRAEMEAGNVFQGMREAVIRFPPTYKFDKCQTGLAGYDSGEKKRVPAWCDRILYRDNRFSQRSECCLECPVVSLITLYDACMDVTDSDHKPVRALFSVDIARVDESVRRQEFGDIVKYNDEVRNMLELLCQIPETVVSTNNIILQNQDATVLRITNKSDKDKALFEIICEDQSVVDQDKQASDHHPGGSFGFPRWLEVIPAVGMIEPDQLTEVSVHLVDFSEEFVDGVPRNSWCEDTRDEEVILVVKVRGTHNTTATKNHRIRVRHCCSGQMRMIQPKPHVSRQGPANILHRSDYQHLSSSYDVVDHLRNLQSP